MALKWSIFEHAIQDANITNSSQSNLMSSFDLAVDSDDHDRKIDRNALSDLFAQMDQLR